MSKNQSSPICAKPPRIGLTMRFDEKGDFYLRREYSEALAAFGAVPLHLPLIPNEEFINRVVGELDGILLPGSDSDVDPLRYGEQPQQRLGKVQPLRDETDLMLIGAAEQRQLPILGICYGMQALNVARGGTLQQDIESQTPSALAHQQQGARERRSHHILVESNSWLKKISAAVFETSVNSHHHQSIGVIGENLRVTARAADNIIEAIEDVRPDRFAVGVQWHPELGWENDQLSRSIFKAFVEAAARSQL